MECILGMASAWQHQADAGVATALDAAAQAGSTFIFWAVVGGYFVAVLGFGAYFARFNRTTSDFFFGGRRFAWWLTAISIVATGVSSHSFIKYSGAAFGHGLSATMAYLNDWFFMPLFMFGWLPIIYFARISSIPEYFERRFNGTVRVLATVAILGYMLGYLGIGYLTMAKAIEPTLLRKSALFTLAGPGAEPRSRSLAEALAEQEGRIALAGPETRSGKAAAAWLDRPPGDERLLVVADAAAVKEAVRSGRASAGVLLRSELGEPDWWIAAEGPSLLMLIVWIVAVISGIYITFGGQTAVIFTDLLQGFLLLFGGILLFLMGVDFLGGFERFWRLLPPEFKLPLADFNQDPGFNFVGIFWQDAIAGSIGFLFMNQALIMRFLSCRSVNEGRKAAACNVLLMLPISALAVAGAGLIGRAMAQPEVGLIPSNLHPDDVFVRVASVVASPLGFGFFVAAVVSALMSTVETFINAIAAVFVNDVYKPLLRGRDDKHYLRVAMIVSALGSLLGVVGAWIFTRFDSLYEAHGYFHSYFTPPLVAAIFLGVFWPRFNSAGALATFLLGVPLMVLGEFYPQVFIRPFAHGTPPKADGSYVYISALYNMVVCFGVGIAASLLLPRWRKPSAGLTLWTVESARRSFKGGEPNDAPGFKLPLRWKREPDLPHGTVRVDRETLEGLAAQEGDLVYVCDRRWWLAGLRSTHAHLHGVHDHGEVVYLAPDVADAGYFLDGRMVTVEKEL